MAGYEKHAASCAHCGAEMELRQSGGRWFVDADVEQEATEYRRQWGSVTIQLSQYGLDEWESDIHDSEWVDGEVTGSTWKCPSCEGSLCNDTIVCWAWTGPVELWELLDEFGYDPDDHMKEVIQVGGEWVALETQLERMLLSLTGDLYDPLELEAVTEAVSAFTFVEAHGPTCGHHERQDSWQCELEEGHEGYHMIPPGRYLELGEPHAWDEDGDWVETEAEAPSVSQVSSLLADGRDLFAELGI